MSKHAYLIIAHKVDYTLQALISMIDDPRNDIFLHMDKKNTLFRESDIAKLVTKSRLYVIQDRLSVSWGGESQMKCELVLFEKATQTGSYDYYHLLSGQDLPLKSQDCIHDFFNKNQGKEFIRFQSPTFNCSKRVRYYHFFRNKIGRNRRKYLMLLILEKISLFIQRLLCVHRNKHIVFQKGTNWVSVTDSFARELVNSKSEIYRIFKHTLCCDEIYKHTFAANNPKYIENLYYKDFDNNPKAMVRLIDWTRGRPYVWKISDKDELDNSDMMFARKFDAAVDKEIILYLQNKCRGN